MRSRFRIQMLQKRRLITNRVQWMLIGLTSLIAVNTTLYWSITQNIRTLPRRDNDVSEFPIRQKVISIDDNWGELGERHWEVIDPVEDDAAHVKPSQHEKQGGDYARKNAPVRIIKRKTVSTDRPNVRYITLKSSVQASNKDEDPVKVCESNRFQVILDLGLSVKLFHTVTGVAIL